MQLVISQPIHSTGSSMMSQRSVLRFCHQMVIKQEEEKGKSWHSRSDWKNTAVPLSSRPILSRAVGHVVLFDNGIMWIPYGLTLQHMPLGAYEMSLQTLSKTYSKNIWKNERSGAAGGGTGQWKELGVEKNPGNSSCRD